MGVKNVKMKYNKSYHICHFMDARYMILKSTKYLSCLTTFISHGLYFKY